MAVMVKTYDSHYVFAQKKKIQQIKGQNKWQKN